MQQFQTCVARKIILVSTPQNCLTKNSYFSLHRALKLDFPRHFPFYWYRIFVNLRVVSTHRCGEVARVAAKAIRAAS